MLAELTTEEEIEIEKAGAKGAPTESGTVAAEAAVARAALEAKYGTKF
jgi:hypothetical protein